MNFLCYHDILNLQTSLALTRIGELEKAEKILLLLYDSEKVTGRSTDWFPSACTNLSILSLQLNRKKESILKYANEGVESSLKNHGKQSEEVLKYQSPLDFVLFPTEFVLMKIESVMVYFYYSASILTHCPSIINTSKCVIVINCDIHSLFIST